MEAEMFDPFDILPDVPVLVAEPEVVYAPAPARKITPSTLAKGNNGNNLPKHVGANLNGELEKRREGRMSTFTLERAAALIEGIEEGIPMDVLAAQVGINRSTIYSWMQLCPEFSENVARAREMQGHSLATDAVKILDEVTVDPENPKAAMAELRKAEQRARIRMDLAKAFNFKQYGDKKQNLNLNINAEVSPVDLANYA